MKMYEIYTCRRRALGLTRQQLADKCGITVKEVVDFENGKKIDWDAVENIKAAIRAGFNEVNEVEHYRLKILELAMELKIEDNSDHAMVEIGHMLVEIGKLQMNIMENK